MQRHRQQSEKHAPHFTNDRRGKDTDGGRRSGDRDRAAEHLERRRRWALDPLSDFFDEIDEEMPFTD